MPRKKSPWHVERPPDLPYAFFISHVREDAEAVRSLKSEMILRSGEGGRRELACYLDETNWEIGNDPCGVIRANLLKSEYMVAWITSAYLAASRRGWIWYEFAYAELIELSLNTSRFGTEFPFILPIFHIPITEDVQHSPLANYWVRRPLAGIEAPSPAQVAQKLISFYYQELFHKRGRASLDS